jgi:FAD/FMN-containing dehydrogenase
VSVPAPAVAGLIARLGESAVLHLPQDIAGHERGARYGSGRALCVALPRDLAEVRKVVLWAREHHVRLIPQGANTGLVAAASPDSTGSQAIVSLERLRARIEIDVENRSVRVDAGVRLHSLNERLAEEGFCFPIDLGANPSIGGMIAANTGGARLLRYGDVRSNLLGVEAVLADADATVIDVMGGLRKDNSGIDLKQLFVGTSGAFGIVTAAVLEIHPMPLQRATALLVPADPAAVPAILRRAESRFAGLLCSFEGMSRAAMECVFRHRPRVRNPFEGGPTPQLAVLMELASPLPHSFGLDLERALETFLCGLAEGDKPLLADALLGKAEQGWDLRHAISDSLRDDGTVIAFDLSVRRSVLTAFRARVTGVLEAAWPHLRICEFGHLGDGGVHLNLVWPFDCGLEPYPPEIQAIRDRVYGIVVDEFRGSFSAEHGVGPYNQGIYSRHTPPERRKLAGELQRLFDPDRLLGTVEFGGEEPAAG